MPLSTGTIVLDGIPLTAFRETNRARSMQVQYVTKVGSTPWRDQDAAASMAWDTWHRGSGASRKGDVPGQNAWSENGDPSSPGIWLPGPARYQIALPNQNADVPPTGLWEQDGLMYVVAGRYVSSINAGALTPAATAVQDLGVGFQALGTDRWNGSQFVGGGWSGNIWEHPDGGVWTNTLLASTVQRGPLTEVTWVIGGVAYETLVAADGLTAIRYTSANPRDSANWTPGVAGAAISTGPYPIVNIIAFADHVYVVTTGGIRDLDSTGKAPNLTPEWEMMPMSTNGAACVMADGYLYAGAGYGVGRLRVAGTNTYAQWEWCTPMENQPSNVPVRGVVSALTRRGGTLYCAQYDALSDTTYISYGREAQAGEQGPIVWSSCPIVLPGYKVTAMRASGLRAQAPRLWMACTHTADSVRSVWWAHLAVTTPWQDYIAGGEYRFTSPASLILSDEDFGSPAVPDDLDEVVIETEGNLAGASLKVQVAADSSSDFQTVATITGGPRTVIPTLVDVFASRMTFKLTATGLPTAPVPLRKVEARAMAVEERRQVKTYRVIVGQEARTLTDNITALSLEDFQARMEAMLSGPRVTLVDEVARTHTVRLRDFSVVEGERLPSGEGERTSIVELRLLVLSSAPVAASLGYDGLGGYDDPAWRYDA